MAIAQMLAPDDQATRAWSSHIRPTSPPRKIAILPLVSSTYNLPSANQKDQSRAVNWPDGYPSAGRNEIAEQEAQGEHKPGSDCGLG